ncbi:TauD/TfdA dioxygenase family protein [Novosphingobium sp. JCM 18896]|uniref:TauD/TfdA dioxygenase family protein n=1 Tax=Novosphingobium sp. JCM 18896 TaxID=2989731 RepID=UPI0022230962|nr:TauD/TfdA family dioxygenase [Novosphingobium sp. JCM 18896]MCW1430034.1 TauD/TfdA family dioxygenase [Novosphingobium sp. JCM 18896]
MADIKVSELSSEHAFGARIAGLNWDIINDPAVRERIAAVFVERGMIVFEDMEPSAKMQVAVSKIFGPLKDHPTKSTPRDGETGDEAEGVIDMHYDPKKGNNDAGGLVEIDGQVLARFSPWHFDHCYNDELNYAGVLRSPIVAPEGGRTGFMDGIELYKNFPKDLLAQIEGLNVIYTLDTRLTKQRFGVNFKAFEDTSPPMLALLKEVAIFPRAMHPAVWTRETGEKVLHIGPWMSVGVEHNETPEFEKVYDAVCHEINRQGTGNAAYWHEWKPTDLVIWDNHRMVHAVEGCDAQYERQTLRTTIKGDYGHGYFEDGKKIGEVFREVA